MVHGQWWRTPGSSEVIDLSGTGPNDDWAVGAPELGGVYEVEHYSGSQWTNIASAIDSAVVTTDGVGSAEAVLFGPDGYPHQSVALRVSDPDGPNITSLSMTPLAWDPSWGTDVLIRGITSTPQGAPFAVGSIRASGQVDVQQGIVFRDCPT